MRKHYAHRVVLRRFAPSFFDHVKVQTPQVVGDLSHHRVAAHEYAAGHLALADAELEQQFSQSHHAIVPGSIYHFHARLAAFVV